WRVTSARGKDEDPADRLRISAEPVAAIAPLGLPVLPAGARRPRGARAGAGHRSLRPGRPAAIAARARRAPHRRRRGAWLGRGAGGAAAGAGGRFAHRARRTCRLRRGRRSAGNHAAAPPELEGTAGVLAAQRLRAALVPGRTRAVAHLGPSPHVRTAGRTAAGPGGLLARTGGRPRAWPGRRRARRPLGGRPGRPGAGAVHAVALAPARARA